MISGYDVFGKAYGEMLRNDLHASNSIDHQFLKEMILVDEDSVHLLYGDVCEIPQNIEKHELFEFAQQFKSNQPIYTIKNILEFTSQIALNYDIEFLDMTFGGKEKDIIARGTDWCADMARVGCVLLQCNNIPARIVHIVNKEKAYHGHVICEAFFNGNYGICDFIYGVIGYDTMPISAWEMKLNKDLVTKCYSRDYEDWSITNDFEGLFSEVAINEYNIMDTNNKYVESKANEYTKRIILESHNDRWFMNEDIN